MPRIHTTWRLMPRLWRAACPAKASRSTKLRLLILVCSSIWPTKSLLRPSKCQQRRPLPTNNTTIGPLCFSKATISRNRWPSTCKWRQMSGFSRLSGPYNQQLEASSMKKTRCRFTLTTRERMRRWLAMVLHRRTRSHSCL